MRWTAIVPLKTAGTRKSRLAGMLSAAERDALSEAMLARVAAVLAAHPAIARTVLLAAAVPAGWGGDWRRDEGRGLNAELEAAAAAIGDTDLLVVHADLPSLGQDDIDAMLHADGRVALAPDLGGRGTNAIAVRAGVRFAALFGEDSFARFGRRYPEAVPVRRDGLAGDVDAPADLARAEAAGFRWRQAVASGGAVDATGR